MNYYKRSLPHWQPHGAAYFITFRLANSLPKVAIHRLRKLRKQALRKSGNMEELGNEVRDKVNQRIFKRYEDLLDGVHRGSTWLKNEKVAQIVADSIEYRHKKKYDLLAYCIMPNHVHLVIKLLDPKTYKSNRPVTDIIGRLKSYTASQANRELGRKGVFWQPESYDHVIRDGDEMNRIIRYTLDNPVKAGLVKHWKDWKFSYVKDDLL